MRYKWLIECLPVLMLTGIIFCLALLHGCTTVPVTPSTFCTDYNRVTLTKSQWLTLPDTAAQQILANERFYRDHCK